jgi:hypothetical protein
MKDGYITSNDILQHLISIFSRVYPSWGLIYPKVQLKKGMKMLPALMLLPDGRVAL